MEMDREGTDGSDDNLEEDGNDGSGSRESSEGGTAPAAEDSNGDADPEEEMYDIALAATHSYMNASELVPSSGRRSLEAGWRGRVPVVAHHGVVFPGETVPMVLPDPEAAALVTQALRHDHLFGLLCPDETCNMISGYGVLCEVYEAGLEEQDEGDPSMTIKARAIHRFRLTRMPKFSVPINAYRRSHITEVTLLPDITTCDTLSAARLRRLDPLSRRSRAEQRLRSMEAAATPWPLFVHDIFDYQRMRNTLHEYFKTIMMDKLPEEPVSLSFWAASNLPLSARDRLQLFVVDNALLRLHMECRLIKRKEVLCCSSCLVQIARREHIFPMSSEGAHSNFVNLNGYIHDLLTVSQTMNLGVHGTPSAEYSWFPGYAWTPAVCAGCGAHIGWRFVALKSALRPQHFYGLCRNYVRPCAARRDLAPHGEPDDGPEPHDL